MLPHLKTRHEGGCIFKQIYITLNRKYYLLDITANQIKKKISISNNFTGIFVEADIASAINDFYKKNQARMLTPVGLQLFDKIVILPEVPAVVPTTYVVALAVLDQPGT